MKSLLSSLFAAMFVFATATAFAESQDIQSPWWDSEHVQLNPGADETPTPPAPDTDKDKDKQ